MMVKATATLRSVAAVSIAFYPRCSGSISRPRHHWRFFSHKVGARLNARRFLSRFFDQIGQTSPLIEIATSRAVMGTRGFSGRRDSAWRMDVRESARTGKRSFNFRGKHHSAQSAEIAALCKGLAPSRD